MSLNIAETVIDEFLEELSEMTDRLVLNTTELEKQPGNQNLIREIYRDIHTIKGNAMIFGLPLLGKLTHSLENVLELVREHELPLVKDLGQKILEAIDYSNSIGKSIATERKEPDLEIQVDKLVKYFDSQLLEIQKQTHIPRESEQTSTSNIDEQSSEKQSKAQQLDEQNQESIRVSVSVLDKLMNLAGELVLIRNQFQERSKSWADEDAQLCQGLNLVISELQGEVMKTRMQPVGSILNKFHRVIRDLSNELGKDIEFKIEGADTELDRALLSAIRDPLMHIIRNSADHGIEPIGERHTRGKPRIGTITAKSYQQGGQVVVEILDDGRGLDAERIRKKAVEKGLISSSQAQTMNNEETFQLVFHPGFSTAEKVSNVSGRGVGMDVVKTNIERFGGSVEINSQQGHGTSTILRIPLTLAIMPALLVSDLGIQYAIAQSRIVEVLQAAIGSTSASHAIEFLEGQAFCRLRGELLTLICLGSLFDKNNTTFAGHSDLPNSSDQSYQIVVLENEGIRFGLVVEKIDDSIDIVVKPLGQVLNSIQIFSGATILGDGRIALALDVSGIASYAKIKRDADHTAFVKQAKEADDQDLIDEIDYLTVRLGSSGNYAVPVCHVHRLEEILSDKFYRAGGLTVTQYQDGLLPILSLSQVLQLSDGPREMSSLRSIVVIESRKKLFGIEVDSISDIISPKVEIDSSLKDRAGIAGGFIFDGRVYTILDVFEIMGQLPNSKNQEKSDKSDRQSRHGYRLLLAEDSPHFRKQIMSFLIESGYQVTSVADGEQAWLLLESAAEGDYHLLVSDIEMPKLDGIGLAQRVRKLSHCSKMPLIAVTSKFSDLAIQRGKSAGFNSYLQKLDQEELIQEIDRILGISA